MAISKFLSFFVKSDTDRLSDISRSSVTRRSLTPNQYMFIDDEDDEDIVYHNNRIERLRQGTSFIITGTTLITCESFSISLICEDNEANTALYVNPRLPHNFVVRNSRKNYKWGHEQAGSIFPFVLIRGSQFAIEILVTKFYYMIAINGQHYAKFNHVLNYTRVDRLDIRGDVTDIKVIRMKVKRYPDALIDTRQTVDIISLANLSKAAQRQREWKIIRSKYNLLLQDVEGFKLPYVGIIPKQSIYVGRIIKIEGRVKSLPQCFYINLQQGHYYWPHPVVALQFNPRFKLTKRGKSNKPVVCCNAWVYESWENALNCELNNELRPGKIFNLSIYINEQYFDIYLNYQLLLSYEHKVDPAVIDTVIIVGDLKLWTVKVEDMPNSLKQKLYSDGKTGVLKSVRNSYENYLH